jgi:hypothetical protein
MDFKVVHDGVQVRVMQGDALVDGAPTAEAVALYTSLIGRLDELRRFAADALLPLHNETWLDDDIGPVDQAGFVARLANPAIVVYDQSGMAAVLFEDGGLFAGHWIEVSIDRGEPTGADLAG